jgi:hypothetical protein
MSDQSKIEWTDATWTHVWRWRRYRPTPLPQLAAHPLAARAGTACRLVTVGRLNSALVEFPDGLRVVTSRYAVRRAT